MGRYSDINPMDLDPDTGRPYANYSSPSLDTSFHDGEMDVDDDEGNELEPIYRAQDARHEAAYEPLESEADDLRDFDDDEDEFYSDDPSRDAGDGTVSRPGFDFEPLPPEAYTSPECETCGDTGIASSGPTFDCGDGEGEDQPCPDCTGNVPTYRAHVWLLSLYEIDIAYGGPEEGGWYYDTRHLRRTIRGFSSKEKAYAACRRCNAWLDRLQEKHRPVHSVLYGGGRHRANVHANHAPQYEPATRPHYE